MAKTDLVEHEADTFPTAAAANVEVAISRASQEVQAAMAVAKRFPRDMNAAHARLMQSCRRKGLAEAAIYEYPRGGQKVEGPSIRLAEAAAQCWGNLDFGVIEVEQSAGQSVVMAYAWDLETNTRQVKTFTVKHERHTRQGRTFLTDPRDIYEMVANQGARRLRACILGVIPGDVIDDAVAQCEKTLIGDGKEPIGDRIRKMLKAFAEFTVTQEMVEAKLGHKVDAITETELAKLRKTYTSIKDGMGGIHDFFSPTGTQQGSGESATGSKSERLSKEMDAKKSGGDQGKDGTKVDGAEVIAFWKIRIDACKTQKELEAEYPRFDAVRGELDKATGDTIEAAFAAGVKSFSEKK